MLTTRELSPQMWPQLERLFGAKGACAGCWCMFWRLEKGETFDGLKGVAAKARFRKLVASGAAHGVLAFNGDEPVGWCSFERRVELAKLDRAPSLACDDAAQVWSLPCFFVASGWRGKGVASVLLRAALIALRARGARIVESYPVKPRGVGLIPAAFAHTGVPALFEPAGFKLVEARAVGKQRYRKLLRPPAKRAVRRSKLR